MKTEITLQLDILENLPFIAAFLKPDHEIVWANSMYRDFAGISNEQLAGRKCFLLWRTGKQCVGCPACKVIESGTPAEFLLPGPQQRPWLESQGKWSVWLIPVRGKDGLVSGILEVAHEITPEQEVRQALRKSEARLRQAEQLAHIGHWELDLINDELYWSDEIFDIFEIDARQFGASYAAFLAAAHPDDREKIHAAYTDSLENRTSYKIDHRLLLPDGRIKHVQERGKNYYDDQGKQIRSLGTVQDITARKNIEAENEKLQRQLLQAQKMESIGRLAGGVAHDYNNISSIIIGYSELAMQKLAPTDPMHEYFTQILNAAKRSSEITRQLLAFARQQTISLKILNLNEILSNLLKMLRRLVGEDIELVFLPDDAIWPVKVDPSQIDQIMANLCVNARDAIKDVGTITIETRNTSFSDAYCSSHMGFIPGDYVLLSVSDNGRGIAPENIEKVFEPFFTTKEIGKGTGLGMATVFGIVKQNNGFINLYSEPGEGTVFKIYLPRHSGPIEHATGRKAVEIPTSRGETVLFVEDEASIRKIGKILLLQLGYAVLDTGSPLDAIQMAKDHAGTIDLLITDVVMPEMNGRVLSERLAQRYPRMKTLFISGYTANVIVTRGVLQDGMFFLSKPFSRESLAFKIREVLG